MTLAQRSKFKRQRQFELQKVRSLIGVWRSGQVQLPEVTRWSRFHGRSGERLRTQNCLQHSYSFTVLASIMLAKFSAHGQFDEPLVQLAALIHDHGEGELASDVPFTEKMDDHDFAEYTAFVRRYAILEPDPFYVFHRAYLLQFVFKESASLLPQVARDIVAELSEHQAAEALLFAALEHWDYLLYAFEQYECFGNTFILAEVLSSHIPFLDEFALQIPGFKKEVWPSAFRRWCARFLEEHGHLLSPAKPAA